MTPTQSTHKLPGHAIVTGPARIDKTATQLAKAQREGALLMTQPPFGTGSSGPGRYETRDLGQSPDPLNPSRVTDTTEMPYAETGYLELSQLILVLVLRE